jgi:hypothetical protein
MFISYRRDDNADATGRIADWLVSHFGREQVFRDVDGMFYGVDFRRQIDQAVSKCDVLLAIIGEQWLDSRHTDGPNQGQRRLDEPGDFVRTEIQVALSRGIPVIPVLVGKATMPREGDLPEGLKPPAYLHAAEVRAGGDFPAQVERLIEGIKQVFSQWSNRPCP